MVIIRICSAFDSWCVSQTKIKISLELTLKFDHPYCFITSKLCTGFP